MNIASFLSGKSRQLDQKAGPDELVREMRLVRGKVKRTQWGIFWHSKLASW